MSIAPSVRLAMPAEAAHLARLQREAWQRTPEGAQLAEVIDEETAVAAWAQAIGRPPLATMRVLVAVDPFPVGFAVTGPNDDPDARPGDGVIAEFVVPDPDGDHAGRLLNAAVDTLKADGFTRAVWWLRTDDDALRALLTETGWAADGAHREIGSDDGLRLKMVRMVTLIGDEDANAAR